jgi:hypothetical protein
MLDTYGFRETPVMANFEAEIAGAHLVIPMNPAMEKTPNNTSGVSRIYGSAYLVYNKLYPKVCIHNECNTLDLDPYKRALIEMPALFINTHQCGRI